MNCFFRWITKTLRDCVLTCKELRAKLTRFYLEADWVKWNPYIYMAIAVIVFTLIYNINTRNNETIRYYSEIVSVMETHVDSLSIKCYEDNLLMKIGEIHVAPHHSAIDISKESVASLLTEIGAWYPDIIMAQIQFESCYGKSNVAAKSNNILGMKVTMRRSTTQIKNTDYNGYGIYTNWQSCVVDRVLWDYSFFDGQKPDRDTYINTLNTFYGGYGSYGDVMDKYGKDYIKYLS